MTDASLLRDLTIFASGALVALLGVYGWRL